MADRYITEADVYAHMEAPTVRAILSKAGLNLTLLIERATALVKSYLRNSGYTPPTTTDPDSDITDETLRLGTMGALRQMLCSMPSSSLALPDGWNDHPERVAFLGILNGDAVLDLPRADIAAVGGMKFTTSTVGTTYARRATRDKLTGF